MDILEIKDLEKLAKKRVPKMFFDYVNSGSWTETTYNENVSDYSKIKLRQRVAVDMTNRKLNTKFFLIHTFSHLIINQLAAKELYVAKYYASTKKWIPAINRFRTVVDKYDTTIYVEEALHRLVECYYTLGLTKEAQKYANLLGYNYQSSEWYEKSYKIFNKKYK